MSIQPEGESLRKAVQWISEEKKAGSPISRQQLIEAACLKFNLTPMEAEYLARSFKEIIQSSK
jgi:hypothetical protein